MGIGDLKRNDVKGAMKVYEAEWNRTGGEVDGDFVQMLYMLQDDTGPLGDAMEAFNKARGIE